MLKNTIIATLIVIVAILANKNAEHDRDFQRKVVDLETRMNQRGKIVYCVSNIAEGQIISPDALEEREIESAKIPADAISSISLAAGRTTKYALAQGEIVGQHDLASSKSLPKSEHDPDRQDDSSSSE